MPKELTLQRWKRIEPILDRALELGPDERTSFLDEACAGDQDLRTEIRSLIDAECRADNFLEIPVALIASADQFGGKYRLLRRIGSGGMGDVYEAAQLEPVRRRVALKLIKEGTDSEQIIRRFESERQALAIMDHPAIAKIFDAGATTGGAPYFVMEYVRGIRITDHCDTHGLSLRERLELFSLVCDGVQHAHRNGVIHRDIKPSNILIALYDDRSLPKIIDFGVAKAIDRKLIENEVVTAVGQIIGTPYYMSPEQVETDGKGIDARSDVYSLGILLYELVTGVLPLDEEQFGTGEPDELRRCICRSKIPKPSERLKRLPEDVAQAIAVKRNTDADTLRRLLERGPDRIVLAALAKNRALRHSTAAELAADLRRFLESDLMIAEAETEYGSQSDEGACEIPLAWLAVVQEGAGSGTSRLFQITRSRTLIGRGVHEPDLCLDDTRVGRRHTVVCYEIPEGSEKHEFVLHDLASKNGTKLNGLRATAPEVLHDGDRISLGRTKIVFKRV